MYLKKEWEDIGIDPFKEVKALLTSDVGPWAACQQERSDVLVSIGKRTVRVPCLVVTDARKSKKHCACPIDTSHSRLISSIVSVSLSRIEVCQFKKTVREKMRLF